MTTKTDQDILTLARKRMAQGVEALSESREDELEDLKFAAGSPDNNWQWPGDVLATRSVAAGQIASARPCITINKLPQHIKQITNDQRQNRPSGKVIPANEEADVEVAAIYDGLIRHIEYVSDADVAYDTACEAQVTFGEGYFRILTQYAGSDTFDQDIRIGRIRNSFSVIMDPLMQDPCGADAGWCFVFEDMPRDEYERQFPRATPISTLTQMLTGDVSMAQWLPEGAIRVADYYYIENSRATLNLYPDGRTAIEGSLDSKQAMQEGLPVIKTRPVEVKTTKYIKTNGYEVLEENVWPGQYIPVIRVVGNEFEVEGKLHVTGIVRNAKDPQRMYNYWVSQEAEMLALAPKAPFIGYSGQFEGYEQQWKTANTVNWPYLEVNADVTDGQGAPLPLPQRSLPPMAQNGLIAAKMGAADDIKATTGQYDSSLGQTSNERSGRAIMAREKQADTGTYHYVDNLARAVRYCTRQLVDLIPKIYDTQRIARIIGIDGEPDQIQIDPEQKEPVRKIEDDMGAIKKIYNPAVGKYDVRVTTGPSYMTKRQEALYAMTDLLKGNPNLWNIAGDLFVKHMDWPGADELAARFAKTLDPKLLAGDDQSPELQAAQAQIQQMGQEMDKMHQMLKSVQQSIEMQKLENEQFNADISAYNAETKRLTALSGTAAQTPVSEDIQAVVKQYIQEIFANPSLAEQDPSQAGQPQQPDLPLGQ